METKKLLYSLAPFLVGIKYHYAVDAPKCANAFNREKATRPPAAAVYF